jgi:hypothetical protein
MIELSLIHDGRHWVARADSWTARGRTIQELDRAVAAIIRETRKPGDGRQLEVRMNFDTSVIPQWMRQYSNHYFNRLVKVDLRPETDDDPVAEGT